MPVGTILTYYCTMASYAVTRNGSDTKKTTMVKSFLLSSANYSPAMKDSVAFPGQTPVIVLFGVLIPRASQKYSKGFESKFGEQ